MSTDFQAGAASDPPPDPVNWWRVSARVSALVDAQELLSLTRAVVEDGPPPELSPVVHAGVLQALAQSSSPGLVGECLRLLLGSRPALQHVSEGLHDLCLDRARPPAFDAEPRAWLLAADALETATQLALGDWVPRYGLLDRLTRLPAVLPPSYARVALRCLAACYEHWREQPLVTAMERLAGVTPAAATSTVDPAVAKEWAHEIEPDAAYELGCASLLQALGGATVTDAEAHLQAAASRLSVAAADRDDAAVLGDVVLLLTTHLPTDTGRAAHAATDLSALADRLEREVREHVLGIADLQHWRAPRLDAEVAWAQLAGDVARSSAALGEVSWYHAEEALADVLTAYAASRCSRVLRREDQAGVRAILGPAIESGIAVQAGLMKHLEDHIRVLERTIAEDLSIGAAPDSNRVGELEAARSLLTEARARLVHPDGHPKRPGSADSALPDLSALPLLTDVLGGDVTSLAAVPPGVLLQLEAGLAVERRRARALPVTGDTLVVTDLFVRLQNDLLPNRYYTGEVREVVDQLALHLLRFWQSRDGLGARERPYLFASSPAEEDLASDLKDFFDGTGMAGLLRTEVRHFGGGRIDVACVFPLFQIAIELKKDDRKIDITEKRRYLAQAAGYQGANVTIGFLAILDYRKWVGPTPHINSCFSVVVLDDSNLGEPRHIVTMALPGNRTPPSSMR